MDPTLELLRQEVAACSRMLVDADILNYSGHISARLPRTNTLLIQRVHDVRSMLVPGRLLIVDFDGHNVSEEGKPPGEVFIHTEIYRARPDIGAIGHFHHDPTTVFSVVEGIPLVPVKNHASRWMTGVRVHNDSSQIQTPEQGRAVVKTLESGFALLLRGHGEVIVAEDVPSLFADVIHFVENAQTLLLAAQLGTVKALTQDELASFAATFNRQNHSQKLWKYYTAVAAKRGVIPNEWVLDQDAY
ncbi:MAG TPA: class II aldolase/adducin family protein [Acidimicrobiales bacterium]|nr:class II aldolase/adducin family protein [Acidimicrobiales bacterium]